MLNLQAQMYASCSTPPDGADVNEKTIDMFFTPTTNRPTIQPARICPRLTRARHRQLELDSNLPHEQPIQIEDITATDSRRSNMHDTIDSVLPEPSTVGPPHAIDIGRWYTVSPPRSSARDGMPHHDAIPLIGSYSEAKMGHQVLTSQEHIGDQSLDTTRTYALLYGTVLAEYIDGRTNTPMFLVDYGHPWLWYRITQSLCDLRPLEAQGSAEMVDGPVPEAMPWRGRRELDFGDAGQGADNVVDGGSDAAEQSTVFLGADTPVRHETGRHVHQFPLPLPAWGEWPLVERQIQGYSDDSPATATDDSTAQKPFPKVTISFPSYLLFESVVTDAMDSSGDEWIGGEEDWATYDEVSEEDKDHEVVVNLNGEDGSRSSQSEPVEPFRDGVATADVCINHGDVDEDDPGYEEWSQSSKSFKANPLEDAEFERYYHESNWTSDHITLLGDRNNFSGPHPGYVPPEFGPIPYSPICFFHLFWPASFLREICVETNRYARQRCTRRCRGLKASAVQEEPETPQMLTLNGGKGWEDVHVPELRAWLGIKIYMGLKPLPARRDYWSRSEELFNCRLIASVMTMRRWEAILRCLHLTDNDKLERDRLSPNFDKIGKVRMLLNHFVSTSQRYYNQEREVTVDELIIPYKGKYCSF